MGEAFSLQPYRLIDNIYRDPEYSPEMSRRPKLVLIPDPVVETLEYSYFRYLSKHWIRDQYRLRKVGNDDPFLQPIVVPS